MLNDKDKATISSKLTKAFKSFDRIIIKDAPEAIVSFIEGISSTLQGSVAIVRSHDDISHAASVRNHSEKSLFVFSGKVQPDSYFTSVTADVALSSALILRAEKAR